MRKIKIAFSVFLLFCIGCKNTPEKTFKVVINRNIETLSILYIVADVGLNAFEGSLSFETKLHFAKYKNHKAIKLFKQIIDSTSFDAPVKFFLCLSELPNAKIANSLDTSFVKAITGNQSINDNENLVNQFIKELNKFYEEAKIQEFINNHKTYYDKSIQDVIKNLPNSNFITSMENYYGKKFRSYTLIPSPILFPSIGFGDFISTSEGTDIYHIFGPVTESDSVLNYRYGFDSYQEIRNLSVHEFGHSFVNPIINLPSNQNLIAKYSYLFSPIRNYMDEQAYDNWNTCVIEHIVRMGEIRIAYVMNDSTAANKIRKEYIETNKFIYIPKLEKKILEYENNRTKYKTFSDFFPKLIEAFSEIDTTNISL